MIYAISTILQTYGIPLEHASHKYQLFPLTCQGWLRFLSSVASADQNAAGTGMCVTGASFYQSDFHFSHRSIVLRAVQGKGHEANPTCWELSQILVWNLLAGWGATFATGHQYYFDSQQALSSGVHVPNQNKIIHLWSLISTCVPYFDFEITEPLRNYIMASGFTREVIKRTSVEAASHQNAIFQRSKWRYFFNLSILDFLPNTSLGQLIVWFMKKPCFDRMFG